MATDETTSKAVQVSSSPERPPTAAQQRAAQHKGTADTEVLVKDIEKTREELASTIDEIVDRVSPKKVVERTKQQATEAAKQGVHDATVIVKEAAGVVREKATTAGELLKEKTGTAAEAVKDRVGAGSTDSTPARSPLAPATSVAVGSASPVTASADADAGATASSSSVPSPLPAGTQSVDAGPVPPPEPGEATGPLADAAQTSDSAGARVPSYAPVRPAAGGAPASNAPLLAGAGLAAALALLVLLLRRRSR